MQGKDWPSCLGIISGKRRTLTCHSEQRCRQLPDQLADFWDAQITNSLRTVGGAWSPKRAVTCIGFKAFLCI